MSTVYQHQLHAHRTHRFRWKRWLTVVVVLAGAVTIGLLQLKPDTKIKNASAVSKSVSGQSATETFHKGNFTIKLPKGWQFTSLQDDIYKIYHFKSALGGEQGNRMLDVYVDSELPNFAVNRMLPVTAIDGGGLIANSGDVSDNCTAYTTGETTGRSTVSQKAKWQGIEFLCDMANPQRNVLGIGSKDGMNTVKIKSLSTGNHNYFFTYTENNDKPDYSLFIAALNSFKVDQ